MSVDAGGAGFVFGAPGFVFGRPAGSASAQLNNVKAPHEKQVWHRLPPPTGRPPFRLELAAVLGEQAVAAIAKAGRLVVHTLGDTGGIDNPYPQLIVAQWLEHDAAQHAPAFLYHLGDVVYYERMSDFLCKRVRVVGLRSGS